MDSEPNNLLSGENSSEGEHSPVKVLGKRKSLDDQIDLMDFDSEDEIEFSVEVEETI
jgi:hypothetical protein